MQGPVPTPLCLGLHSWMLGTNLHGHSCLLRVHALRLQQRNQAGLCCLEMMEKAGLANQLDTHPGWGWSLRPVPAHPANPSFTRWSTASPAAVPGEPSWYPAPLQHPAAPSASKWLCTHQHLSVTVNQCIIGSPSPGLAYHILSSVAAHTSPPVIQPAHGRAPRLPCN